MQHSDEWYQARVGMVTASEFKDVIGKRKDGKGYLKAREDYLIRVVTERLTNTPVWGPRAASLDWGTDTEMFSRTAYEVATGNMVIESDFIPHPTLMAGASPDGLIGEDGGAEIKTPANSSIHLGTVMNGMPAEHMAQVQGSMWITGRQWWDFVSYDPRMPEHLRLYIYRVERDEDYIKMLESEVIKFIREVDEFTKRLNAA